MQDHLTSQEGARKRKKSQAWTQNSNPLQWDCAAHFYTAGNFIESRYEFPNPDGKQTVPSSTRTTSQISWELRVRAVGGASTILFFESSKDFRRELLFQKATFLNLNRNISIRVQKKTGITGQINLLSFSVVFEEEIAWFLFVFGRNTAGDIFKIPLNIHKPPQPPRVG